MICIHNIIHISIKTESYVKKRTSFNKRNAQWVLFITKNVKQP